MPHTARIKPEWASSNARECDLSDVWIDCVDPQNEDGVEVTGHFTADCDVSFSLMEGGYPEGTTFSLAGVSVDDGSSTKWRRHDPQFWPMETRIKAQKRPLLARAAGGDALPIPICRTCGRGGVR